MANSGRAQQAQLNFSAQPPREEIFVDEHGNVHLRCGEHGVGIKREAIVSIALKILRVGGYGGCSIAHATACGFIWVRPDMTPEDIARIDEEHERQREADDAELYKNFEADGTPKDRTAAERQRRRRAKLKAERDKAPSVTLGRDAKTDCHADAVTLAPNHRDIETREIA